MKQLVHALIFLLVFDVTLNSESIQSFDEFIYKLNEISEEPSSISKILSLMGNEGDKRIKELVALGLHLYSIQAPDAALCLNSLDVASLADISNASLITHLYEFRFKGEQHDFIEDKIKEVEGFIQIVIEQAREHSVLNRYVSDIEELSIKHINSFINQAKRLSQSDRIKDAYATLALAQALFFEIQRLLTSDFNEKLHLNFVRLLYSFDLVVTQPSFIIKQLWNLTKNKYDTWLAELSSSNTFYKYQWIDIISRFDFECKEALDSMSEHLENTIKYTSDVISIIGPRFINFVLYEGLNFVDNVRFDLLPETLVKKINRVKEESFSRLKDELNIVFRGEVLSNYPLKKDRDFNNYLTRSLLTNISLFLSNDTFLKAQKELKFNTLRYIPLQIIGYYFNQVIQTKAFPTYLKLLKNKKQSNLFNKIYAYISYKKIFDDYRSLEFIGQLIENADNKLNHIPGYNDVVNAIEYEKGKNFYSSNYIFILNTALNLINNGENIIKMKATPFNSVGMSIITDSKIIMCCSGDLRANCSSFKSSIKKIIREKKKEKLDQQLVINYFFAFSKENVDWLHEQNILLYDELK